MTEAGLDEGEGGRGRQVQETNIESDESSWLTDAQTGQGNLPGYRGTQSVEATFVSTTNHKNAAMRSLVFWMVLCVCVSGLPSLQPFAPSSRAVTSHLTMRDDETGLLTGNELLNVFYSACSAVRGVINLLNNPVFSVLGISGTVMSVPLPIPQAVFNPLGIPGFFQGLFLNLQDSINSLGKRKRSLPEEQIVLRLGDVLRNFQERNTINERKVEERQEVPENLNVGDVIDALDYPCQALDVFYSFINNSTYVSWLRLGDWPLPLRDPMHKLNLLGIPMKIFNSIFRF